MLSSICENSNAACSVRLRSLESILFSLANALADTIIQHKRRTSVHAFYSNVGKCSSSGLPENQPREGTIH
jgi:hypothetical protein